MKSGELSMVLEIPPGFGRDMTRRLNGVLAAASAGGQPSRGGDVGQTEPVAVGVWIDGAMPQRGETIRGYVQGIHHQWLQDLSRRQLGLRQQLGVGQRQLVTPASVELRLPL